MKLLIELPDYDPKVGCPRGRFDVRDFDKDGHPVVGNAKVGFIATSHNDKQTHASVQLSLSIDFNEPENIPCVGCGGTTMPLHTDHRSPNCHKLDAEVDEHGPDYGKYSL